MEDIDCEVAIGRVPSRSMNGPFSTGIGLAKLIAE